MDRANKRERLARMLAVGHVLGTPVRMVDRKPSVHQTHRPSVSVPLAWRNRVAHGCAISVNSAFVGAREIDGLESDK